MIKNRICYSRQLTWPCFPDLRFQFHGKATDFAEKGERRVLDLLYSFCSIISVGCEQLQLKLFAGIWLLQGGLYTLILDILLIVKLDGFVKTIY
jgi:hypothetical protein